MSLLLIFFYYFQYIIINIDRIFAVNLHNRIFWNLIEQLHDFLFIQKTYIVGKVNHIMRVMPYLVYLISIASPVGVLDYKENRIHKSYDHANKQIGKQDRTYRKHKW